MVLLEYKTQLYLHEFCFSIVHNPYDEQVYLCVAMTKSVLLMQWYEPLDKFMKVKVIHVVVCVLHFRHMLHVEVHYYVQSVVINLLTHQSIMF